MKRQLEDAIQLVVRFRWACFALAVLLSLLCLSSAPPQRDHSIENMFVRSSSALADYQRLQAVFGTNEIVLAVYRDPDLFSLDMTGLERLARIRERCEQVEGVDAVFSIDRPFRVSGVPVGSALAQSLERMFENYTHGADRETAAVACLLKPIQVVTEERRTTIDNLRAIFENLPDGLPPGVLTGEPVMVVDGFRYLERDGRQLTIVSSILLSLVILVSLGSWRWMITALLTVQFSIWLTRYAMLQAGLRLSMVSSTLPAILTVICIATVIHIAVRFRQATRDGLAAEPALLQAFGQLTVPIFWACATDAIAFLALSFARVGPVRDYGIMMAMGSTFVFVSLALLVPTLILWGQPSTNSRETWSESGLARGMSRLAKWIRKRPRSILVLTVALFGFGTGGIARLEVETDFIRNFRANSPLVQSYRIVESKLGGAGVLDVVVPAPAKLNGEYLGRIQRLQDRLRTEVKIAGPQGEPIPALTKVISLADIATFFQPSRKPSGFGQLLNAAGLGARAQQLARAAEETLISVGISTARSQLPEFTDSLYAADPQDSDQFYFRIMLRAPEQLAANQKRTLIAQVTRLCREEFPDQDDVHQPYVTGFFVLLTELIQNVTEDQWTTFSLAAIGVTVVLWMAFRSPILVTLTLVPNLLPVFIVLGAMGWLGLRMNMGAAMVAAVSLGLSVDGSIHFVLTFLQLREKGLSSEDSLRETQQKVGTAATLAVLALVCGFLTLCSSEFVPTIYFGGLVGLAMAGGLLGNLVVLPALLRMFRVGG